MVRERVEGSWDQQSEKRESGSRRKGSFMGLLGDKGEDGFVDKGDWVMRHGASFDVCGICL